MASQYAQENGLTLVVVVPIYARFDAHAPLLREFAQKEGLPIVDLPEILAAFRASDGVGPRTGICLSGLNHAAHCLAVYASHPPVAR